MSETPQNAMPKEQQKTQIGGTDEQPEFYGMDQVLAVFADAYMVSKSGGSYSLYFFQSQMPERVVGQGKLATPGSKHKCVARIVLASEAALDKFLEVLATTRGRASKPQKEGAPT